MQGLSPRSEALLLVIGQSEMQYLFRCSEAKHKSQLPFSVGASKLGPYHVCGKEGKL